MDVVRESVEETSDTQCQGGVLGPFGLGGEGVESANWACRKGANLLSVQIHSDFLVKVPFNSGACGQTGGLWKTSM